MLYAARRKEDPFCTSLCPVRPFLSLVQPVAEAEEDLPRLGGCHGIARPGICRDLRAGGRRVDLSLRPPRKCPEPVLGHARAQASPRDRRLLRCFGSRSLCGEAARQLRGAEWVQLSVQNSLRGQGLGAGRMKSSFKCRYSVLTWD